jgi:hypothetical protein
MNIPILKRHPWLVLAIGVALLLIYEIWAAQPGQGALTISELIWNGTKATPWVPFGFGVLCGHFFWQSRRNNNPPLPS